MSRVVGILLHPRRTLEQAVARPAWAAMLAAAVAISALASAAFYATDTGQLALVDQWERTAIAFGRPVDDAQYARFQAWSTNGPFYAVAGALLGVGGPSVMVALLAAAAFGALSATTVRKTLTITSHAAILLAARDVLGAILGFVRETTASPTAIGRLFPTLDDASPVARVLGALDVFVLWWAVVVGIGLAVVHGRRVRPTVAAAVGLYVTLVLVLAGAMAATGGTT